MADANPNTPPPTLRRRRVLISANVLLQIVAVLAAVGMVNWLVWRHYARFDLTKTGYYKLSDKTRQVLTSLKEPVKVVVFLQPSAEREYLEKVYQDARNLLQEFEFFGKDKLVVEYVDPQRDRARAEQLVAEYKVDVPNVVIFASGPRHKYVTIEDMVDFDTQGLGGGSYRVKAFKGEGAFLSAIQTVTEEAPLKVYFLTGHGEHDPDDFGQRDGYSTLATYIKRDNIAVDKWNLLENQSLPTNAAAIIIAGPRKPYTVVERNALDEYLKNHGRLFVMLDPRQKTGLEDWLKKWGVQVDDDLVVAKGGMLLGTELLVVEALGTDYASHPITIKLEGVNTSFPYARSVRQLAQSEGGAEHPRVTELVKTPPAFWGETDLDSENMAFDPDKDFRGPLPLAVAVEIGKPQGVEVDIGDTRMVVVGSSSFVDNSSLAGGDLDFFMNALNWLLKRTELVAVGPKVPDEFRLDMSIEQVRAVYVLTIIGLPLAVALLGTAVWLRRRK
jgi:gliding motility-associatede transport system auxiliary component